MQFNVTHVLLNDRSGFAGRHGPSRTLSSSSAYVTLPNASNKDPNDLKFTIFAACKNS